LSSKNVVITGASGGIGAALAERLAKDGMRVVIVARREAELREVASRCGGNALPIVADVTNREAVADVVDQAVEHLHIINVSSMLGRIPMAPFRSVYSASKHF